MIQRQLYFWGGYEQNYCKYWISLCRTSNNIFDVGANVGLYSLLAAEANPEASIHAFEPTQEMLDIAKANVRLNNFQNIRINPVAVGYPTGNGVLRDCRGDNGTNEGMNYVVRTGENPQITDRLITVVALDDYCHDNGIDRIDLLKIDIEGGEYDALVGAKALLKSKSIGCLFIEFIEWAAARSGHSGDDITRLLVAAGYLIYRLTPGGLVEVDLEEVPNGENLLAFSSFDLVEDMCRSNSRRKVKSSYRE
jgi:FkbM family methyltransferase